MNLEEIREKIKNFNYMLTEDEVGTLYKYASIVPDKGRIVDIGTACGGSAFIMGMASPRETTIATIDPIKNSTFITTREEWGLLRKVEYFEMTSHEVSSLFPRESIDLLFVDGIHNYNGVMNDFNDYFEAMKPDSIVIFHDYFLYGDTIGKAVDEIMESGRAKKLEIIDSIFRNGARTGMFVSKVCK